jgi:hypothetical protein
MAPPPGNYTPQVGNSCGAYSAMVVLYETGKQTWDPATITAIWDKIKFTNLDGVPLDYVTAEYSNPIRLCKYLSSRGLRANIWLSASAQAEAKSNSQIATLLGLHQHLMSSEALAKITSDPTMGIKPYYGIYRFAICTTIPEGDWDPTTGDVKGLHYVTFKKEWVEGLYVFDSNAPKYKWHPLNRQDLTCGEKFKTATGAEYYYLGYGIVIPWNV